MAFNGLISENLDIRFFDFDPGGTDPVDVGWVDCTQYDGVLVAFFRTIGTSALDSFTLLLNAAADGSGADTTAKTVTVSSEPNAVGDYIFAELSFADLANNAGNLGFSASLEFATGTDEGVVMYALKPKYARAGLCADVIA